MMNLWVAMNDVGGPERVQRTALFFENPILSQVTPDCSVYKPSEADPFGGIPIPIEDAKRLGLQPGECLAVTLERDTSAP